MKRMNPASANTIDTSEAISAIDRAAKHLLVNQRACGMMSKLLGDQVIEALIPLYARAIGSDVGQTGVSRSNAWLQSVHGQSTMQRLESPENLEFLEALRQVVIGSTIYSKWAADGRNTVVYSVSLMRSISDAPLACPFIGESEVYKLLGGKSLMLIPEVPITYSPSSQIDGLIICPSKLGIELTLAIYGMERELQVVKSVEGESEVNQEAVPIISQQAREIDSMGSSNGYIRVSLIQEFLTNPNMILLDTGDNEAELGTISEADPGEPVQRSILEVTDMARIALSLVTYGLVDNPDRTRGPWANPSKAPQTLLTTNQITLYGFKG